MRDGTVRVSCDCVTTTSDERLFVVQSRLVDWDRAVIAGVWISTWDWKPAGVCGRCTRFIVIQYADIRPDRTRGDDAEE